MCALRDVIRQFPKPVRLVAGELFKIASKTKVQSIAADVNQQDTDVLERGVWQRRLYQQILSLREPGSDGLVQYPVRSRRYWQSGHEPVRLSRVFTSTSNCLQHGIHPAYGVLTLIALGQMSLKVRGFGSPQSVRGEAF